MPEPIYHRRNAATTSGNPVPFAEQRALDEPSKIHRPGGAVILAAVGTSSTDIVTVEAQRITRELDGTLHLMAAYRPASTAERDQARRRLPAGLSLDYDDDRLIQARDTLENARETVATDLDVRLHLERGEFHVSLCRVARREAAQVIVAASPHGPLSGRAAARLIRLAPCPVRLVKVAPDKPERNRSGRPDARLAHPSADVLINLANALARVKAER